MAAAKRLGADELLTGGKPGQPLYQVKGLRVRFLATGYDDFTRQIEANEAG